MDTERKGLVERGKKWKVAEVVERMVEEEENGGVEKMEEVKWRMVE